MALIKKTDKIFVAGHKGMAGRSIINSLRNKGYSNLIFVSKKSLDLTDQNKVRNWFKDNKPDVTVIAAAKVGGIAANNSFPVDFLLENLKIQNNLIETSWRNKVHRLLFLGSSCIYPKFAPQPIQEESLLDGYLESTNESYAIAKITGIKLCQSLRKQYNFDAISLMPTNLYGEGDNYNLQTSHVLPALIRKFLEAKSSNHEKVTCWGNGSPLREFLHINDFADACTFVLEKWDPSIQNAPRDKYGKAIDYLNVGTGKDISIKELAYLIKDLTNFKGSIVWDKTKPNGTPKKQLNVNKLLSLGWEAKISLKDGLKLTIDDYIKRTNSNSLRL
tara:strand:+ start:97 stop:1092 length:996 start_codon:yes stop_codon:yes gene_type:complete